MGLFPGQLQVPACRPTRRLTLTASRGGDRRVGRIATSPGGTTGSGSLTSPVLGRPRQSRARSPARDVRGRRRPRARARCLYPANCATVPMGQPTGLTVAGGRRWGCPESDSMVTRARPATHSGDRGHLQPQTLSRAAAWCCTGQPYAGVVRREPGPRNRSVRAMCTAPPCTGQHMQGRASPNKLSQ
jgi:hypothetical protein